MVAEQDNSNLKDRMLGLEKQFMEIPVTQLVHSHKEQEQEQEQEKQAVGNN
jgi:hypothetical protein